MLSLKNWEIKLLEAFWNTFEIEKRITRLCYFLPSRISGRIFEQGQFVNFTLLGPFPCGQYFLITLARKHHRFIFFISV